MESTKVLTELMFETELKAFSESLPTWIVVPEDPNAPKDSYVMRGHFTVSRLIQALQDLQSETGDIPVKVQLESDWDREWEPVEQIEIERDRDGKITGLRLH